MLKKQRVFMFFDVPPFFLQIPPGQLLFILKCLNKAANCFLDQGHLEPQINHFICKNREGGTSEIAKKQWFSCFFDVPPSFLQILPGQQPFFHPADISKSSLPNKDSITKSEKSTSCQPRLPIHPFLMRILLRNQRDLGLASFLIKLLIAS